MLNTSLFWSLEKSEKNIVGYRLQGTHVDVLIKYYSAELNYLSAGAPAYIAVVQSKAGMMSFEVYQDVNGIWHARRNNWEFDFHTRDEAVLNGWLQFYMNGLED